MCNEFLYDVKLSFSQPTLVTTIRWHVGDMGPGPLVVKTDIDSSTAKRSATGVNVTGLRRLT